MSALVDLREEHPVGLVVSSRRSAYGLTRARRLGIPTLVLEKKTDWKKLYDELESRGISHIFLTGFMKVIPREFLTLWSKPLLNIHPSLLPSYPGLMSMERAHADGAALGVTVHRVIADVDAGEILWQKKIAAAADPHSLSLEEIREKMHFAEYELVRKAMKVASCWT